MKKVELEVGNVVICDLCDRDYTKSKEKGGFIWDAKAVCPKCAKVWLKRIKQFKEENKISAFCPTDMSFADFVIRYRGKDAKIIITTNMKGLSDVFQRFESRFNK